MKKYHQYQMNFKSKFATLSMVCMGISMFLSVLYYLGLSTLGDFSGGKLLFCLWLPLILGIAYVVLMGVVRLNAPGTFAILAVAGCVIQILSSFTGGDMGRILLGIPGNLLAILVVIVVVGGFFPAKLPASIVFGAVIALRVIVFDLGRLTLLEWLPELAELMMLAAFMFLPFALTDLKRRPKKTA